VNVNGIAYQLERGDLVHVGDDTAVICPAWSVHSGATTGSYSFICFMAGENYRLDVDHIAVADVR
jgi:4-deoxy-L-threo-5-hexosulose-uronate ketol-isomerase